MDQVIPLQTPMSAYLPRRPYDLLPSGGWYPQDSPISPLLFVLSIASLHPTIPQSLAISDVDDLTLTVGSDSVRSNICNLQHFF